MTQTVEQPAQAVEFVPLLNFEDDYEILNQFPFTIRKKSNHYVLNETIQSNGYVYVHLNRKTDRKTVRKHVLIAKQFLENDDPEHKTQVDHINRIKTDYHLSNLRWISPSDNCRNRTSGNCIEYEYIDNISDEAIVADEYNGYQFTDYFFHNNFFYFFNGIQYRKLHINTDKRNGSLFVRMIDNDGKKVCVYYSKFKKLHDLL